MLGLLIATLADRLRPRGEKTAKTLIFLPLAIGAVSAGVIWKFVYPTGPPIQNQIGLLNGIVTAFGGDPVNWLQISTFRFNSLLLMVMLFWMQRFRHGAAVRGDQGRAERDGGSGPAGRCG